MLGVGRGLGKEEERREKGTRDGIEEGRMGRKRGERGRKMGQGKAKIRMGKK